MTSDNEEQIQDNIQYTRNTQVDQRFCRLSSGTQHAVSKVIDRHRRHTKGIDFHVDHRSVHQLILRVHQRQHITGKCKTDQADHDAGTKADQQ